MHSAERRSEFAPNSNWRPRKSNQGKILKNSSALQIKLRQTWTDRTIWIVSTGFTDRNSDWKGIFKCWMFPVERRFEFAGNSNWKSWKSNQGLSYKLWRFEKRNEWFYDFSQFWTGFAEWNGSWGSFAWRSRCRKRCIVKWMPPVEGRFEFAPNSNRNFGTSNQSIELNCNSIDIYFIDWYVFDRIYRINWWPIKNL